LLLFAQVHKSQLVFWDLGGQRGLRRIWEKYYAESHAVMCVVDAADPGRLEEVKVTLEQMLADEQLLGAPLLVAANKKACIGCHFNWGTCISPKVSPARLSIQVRMVVTGSPLTVPRKARHRQLHCLSVCLSVPRKARHQQLHTAFVQGSRFSGGEGWLFCAWAA
jgi:ADP-ribosylation factor family